MSTPRAGWRSSGSATERKKREGTRIIALSRTSTGIQGCASQGPHLRHQQDQPSFQGPTGLDTCPQLAESEFFQSPVQLGFVPRWECAPEPPRMHTPTFLRRAQAAEEPKRHLRCLSPCYHEEVGSVTMRSTSLKHRRWSESTRRASRRIPPATSHRSALPSGHERSSQ